MILEKAELLQQKSVHLLRHTLTIPSSESAPSKSADVPTAGPFAEKRREKRYVTYEQVEVCILGTENRCVQGILRDVSRSGLRIELGVAVKTGALLEIVLPDRAIIFGEVRYCRRSAHSYQAGVVIEDIYYPKNDTVETGSCQGLWPTRHDRTHEIAGRHVSPDDVAAFLQHDLSETKAAVVERHLAACDECSHLMRVILEDQTSFATRFGNNAKDVQ